MISTRYLPRSTSSASAGVAEGAVLSVEVPASGELLQAAISKGSSQMEVVLAYMVGCWSANVPLMARCNKPQTCPITEFGTVNKPFQANVRHSTEPPTFVTMNTRILLLSLGLFAGTVALAQRAGANPSDVNDRMHAQHTAMVKELRLTPEQDAKILAIEEQYRSDAKVLSASKAETKERHASAVALREQKEAKMKAVLTAAQYERYIALKKEKRGVSMHELKQAQPGHQE